VPEPEIVEMARQARKMLADALEAFVRGDTASARAICERDDSVDALHHSVFRILLTHMMEDPHTIGSGMDLITRKRRVRGLRSRSFAPAALRMTRGVASSSEVWEGLGQPREDSPLSAVAQARRSRCHPERSARNAREAKDLLLETWLTGSLAPHLTHAAARDARPSRTA
jgi:hypothetical protein